MTFTEDLINDILKSRPSAATLHLILATMRDEGRIREVIIQCKEALEVYPDDIPLRRLLAESYVETGSLEIAEKELDTITGFIEELTSVFKIKAEVCRKRNNFSKAADALHLYLAHNPDDRAAKEDLARIESEKEESLPEIPTVVTRKEPVVKPDSSIDQLASPTMAEIWFKQGDVQEAIKTYEKVIKKNPDDEKSWKRLAQLNDMIAGEKVELSETVAVDLKKDSFILRSEKTINILEEWLRRFRNIAHA